MKKYLIGIDTGGTFTDAVLVEKSSGLVLHTTKVPTNHHNLSHGISQALKELCGAADVSTATVDGIAISSTLATNAVVENKGARVAVFVIGYVKHFKLPVKAVVFVKGGHTITGSEEEPLELEYLASLLHSLRDEVDAYGVCAAMSFKNPTHELVTEKAIAMIDPKPVFCSHRLSAIAGMEPRAATAGLHAKLMPLMADFVDGVKSSLNRAHIKAPLHIVSGNGRLLEAQHAVEHAGMTVSSGPACTALFGMKHCSSDAVIIDIGGTTTDITMIKNGRPLFSEQGCRIGKWHTHVEAIDMLTRGIGGDSHVRLDEHRALFIGPQRVTPIAMSECSAETDQWLGAGGASKCIELIGEATGDAGLARITGALQEKGPCTLQQLQDATQLISVPLEKQLENLCRRRLIRETGFTPTDALHVLGLVHLGNGEKSRKSAEILGALLNKNAVEFATMVLEKTTEQIENALLEYLTSHFWKNSLTHFIANRNSHPVLGVDFSIKIPLIGIGAAAKYFLPEIARRLNTTVHFPENYKVGNAIGAALLLRSDEKS
jgi:N-methylhydantoinase A/oxoprolinase/acetone carboxylase beta subunit